MFHKRKGEEKPNPRGERKPRGNLPLIGYNDDDDSDNDKDLEKELAVLMGGGSKAKAKPKQRKPVEVAPEDLDAMVASCMKDYNDDDFSDTEDPDLLAELEDFENDNDDDEEPASGSSDGFNEGVSHSYLQTIRDRLALYKEAESVAKSNGDTSRARRFNRGFKTLQESSNNFKESPTNNSFICFSASISLFNLDVNIDTPSPIVIKPMFLGP